MEQDEIEWDGMKWGEDRAGVCGTRRGRQRQGEDAVGSSPKCDGGSLGRLSRVLGLRA